MPVSAQNTSQNSVENAATTQQSEQAERERIKRERAAAGQELDQQRKACYQKLAVTPCLNEARDVHNEKTRDLKRQQVALNDVQRKRVAADRVKALDQRNSPEVQLKRAQDRGKAMQGAARREESQAQRQASREAKQAEATAKASANTKASSGANAPAKDREITLPEPQAKARQQAAAKAAPDQRPGQAERAHKSAQQAAQREKEAALRREKAAEREAKRKKPAAAGLPIPN